jgi:hypothetical protein
LTNKEEREGNTRQSRIRAWAIDRQDPDVSKGLDQAERKEMSAEVLDVDRDLNAFDGFRGDRGSTKFLGEYHKKGAPDLDKEGLSDYVPMPQEPGVPREKMNMVPNIDSGAVEVITYALFRSVFGEGVNIPIRREGMVDMDITVDRRDVVINTKELFFNFPELMVWKFIYMHKGKPVAEFGRGVDNGMKIHRLQAVRLGWEMWSGIRKQNKEKARLAKMGPPAGDEA